MNPIRLLGQWFLATCRDTGERLRLLLLVLGGLPDALAHPHRVAVQMVRVGWESLPIIGLMAVFTGMVVGLYSGRALESVGGERTQATIVAVALVKEMVPILTALLSAGRIGAAFAAEIGTMNVNEEIDALTTLGVNPVGYLCVPRFVACLVMVPALVMFGNVIGIFGGAVVGSTYFNISYSGYLRIVTGALDLRDITEGLTKAVVSGAIVALISCHKGFTTRGGASGVGRAITGCVVDCFVWIFVANYFVTFSF